MDTEDDKERIERENREILTRLTENYVGCTFWRHMFNVFCDLKVAYSADNPAWISYAKSPETQYDNKRRIKTTVGRFLKRKVGEVVAGWEGNITGVLIGDRVPLKVELFSGEDIPELYDSLARDYGLSSCMVSDDDFSSSDLLSLYVDNPDVIQLAVGIVGTLAFRTLIWKIDGEYYHDRVYSSNGDQKLRQRFLGATRDLLGVEDLSIAKGLYVVLAQPSSGLYPYVDTFKYMTLLQSGNILLSTSEPEETHYLLHETDGGLYEAKRQICSECRVGMAEEDACSGSEGELLCEACFDREYTRCACCCTLIRYGEAHSDFGDILCVSCYTSAREVTQC